MGAWASDVRRGRGRVRRATVVQLRRRGKAVLSYVIGAGDNCVVIDPRLRSSSTFSVPPGTAGRSPTSSIPTCTPITSVAPALCHCDRC